MSCNCDWVSLVTVRLIIVETILHGSIEILHRDGSILKMVAADSLMYLNSTEFLTNAIDIQPKESDIKLVFVTMGSTRTNVLS